MIIDAVIIGGGIVGLHLALKLKEKNPALELAIFEKNPHFGDESTSRNSGVLHAGLYYPKNSLKLKLCLEGMEAWKKICAENRIQLENCGKYIFTSDNSDFSRLESLYQNSLNNNVSVEWVEDTRLEELGEFIRAGKVFFSPNTANLDIPAALKTLERKVHNLDVPMLSSNRVVDLVQEGDLFKIMTEREEIKARAVFNVAGENSVALRKKLGLVDIESKLVKGHYLRYNKEFYNKSLLYPVPLENLKGLGIHTCIDADGSIKFGPNATDVANWDYSFDSGIKEEMIENINANFKGIDLSKLAEDFCGIRTKIIVNGSLYPDFWIKGPAELGIKNYFEALGIESPGLTSSPAIARCLSDLFMQV